MCDLLQIKETLKFRSKVFRSMIPDLQNAKGTFHKNMNDFFTV